MSGRFQYWCEKNRSQLLVFSTCVRLYTTALSALEEASVYFGTKPTHDLSDRSLVLTCTHAAWHKRSGRRALTYTHRQGPAVHATVPGTPLLGGIDGPIPTPRLLWQQQRKKG